MIHFRLEIYSLLLEINKFKFKDSNLHKEYNISYIITNFPDFKPIKKEVLPGITKVFFFPF